MNFTKLFSRWHISPLICAIIVLFVACVLPARAQVEARRTLAFSNAPTFLDIGTSGAAVISNATLNANSYRSNMIPVQFGKGLGLISKFQQASNATAATAATVTHYFGLVFNRTNTPSNTNFTWVVNLPPVAGGTSAYTNIPASLIDNADGVVWLLSQSLATNTLTGFQILGQYP